MTGLRRCLTVRTPAPDPRRPGSRAALFFPTTAGNWGGALPKGPTVRITRPENRPARSKEHFHAAAKLSAPALRPTAQRRKSRNGHPGDVRFHAVRQSTTGPLRKIVWEFWGKGGVVAGKGHLFPARSDRRRPAGPGPSRRRKLRAATATQRPISPQEASPPKITWPPAPRPVPGRPDGWPHNWRVRSRRRTGRCGAA